jgi:hypothetical protein
MDITELHVGFFLKNPAYSRMRLYADSAFTCPFLRRRG